MNRRVISLLLVSIMIVCLPLGCSRETEAEKTDAVSAEVTPTVHTDNTPSAAEDVIEEEDEPTDNGQEEADLYLEAGKNSLYGLNGNSIDKKTAYDNFIKAKEMGNLNACFYLGILCDSHYKYPMLDYTQARSYYEEDPDNPYAKLALGCLYLYGYGVTEDRDKAKSLFDEVMEDDVAEGYFGLGAYESAELNNDDAFGYFIKASEGEEQYFVTLAMNRVANCYYTGFGAEKDYQKAMEWYKKSADLGNASAIYWIAVMYKNGFGVDKDPDMAMEWFRKAVDLGDTSTMIFLGQMYECGLGVDKDYEKAIELYSKAADLNDVSAMSMIALLYRYGTGVEQNPEKMLEWYGKAANLGDTESMCEVGNMYNYGLDGLPNDYSKAAEWYEKAISLKNTAAMRALGNMYEKGRGFNIDYDKAMELYQKASDLGDHDAMYDIAYMYETGLGVGQDMEKAKEWYKKAADAGNDDAGMYLYELEGEEDDYPFDDEMNLPAPATECEE